METIEGNLWEKIVRKFLITSPEATLSKAQQQALALALQEWSARCIATHLETIWTEQGRDDLKRYAQKEVWQIHYRGKAFLGAVRWQEVDVWMTNAEAGLVLAVDPKHFQSPDSLKKNWKNGYTFTPERLSSEPVD